MYITPKEVYHLFSSHHDTKHHSINSSDGLQISSEHHHCELSKIDQQFSAGDIQLTYHDFSKIELYYPIVVPRKFNQIELQCKIAERILRGPPVV